MPTAGQLNGCGYAAVIAMKTFLCLCLKTATSELFSACSMANRKLTPREAKWLDGYLTHGNASRAAEEAGYSARSRAGLAEAGYRLKVRLAPNLHEMMDRMELGEGELLLRLRQGLDAMVVKTAQTGGEITDERVYIDFPTRATFLDMALKLRGLYARGQASSAEPGALDFLRGLFVQVNQVGGVNHAQLDEDGE